MSIVASIKALPQSTVHRIGSSQALVDSCSVVKELVDNALDARATSLSIEISFNALDVIQVTDNGHGITPEDRTLVCRRYTTSKISDISDLMKLGGTSLGFRGEAMHSLANLSGGLTITTRVDGEITAVKLIIEKTGEVERRETASHAVGTTVRATDFFHNLPIRKQTAHNAAPQTLAKIKRMLQAYTFARPTVRFSFKVLKAKTEKGNFLYAPKAGASSVKDAAYKVLGKDCASQCSWSVNQSHGFELHAFCPTSEAVPWKISNAGQFISVDSRPMATFRGTMKQIVALFNEKLRQSNESLGSVKDPFLCLNIVCPTASYDPNVEPGKDDVLFDDGTKVLTAVTSLFSAIYPAQKGKQSGQFYESTPLEVARNVISWTSIEQRPSETLEPSHQSLEPPERPSIATVHEGYDENLILGDDELSFLEQRAQRPAGARPNMYGCDEEDLELWETLDNRDSSQENEDPNEVAREVNPWILAKMNAPVRRNAVTPSSGPCRLAPTSWKDRTENNISLPTTPDRHASQGQRITSATSNSWTAINHSSLLFSHSSESNTFRPQSGTFGLLTPHPSSSPSFGMPLDAIPSSISRPRQTHNKANINKSFVEQLRDSNWNFGPPSWPKRKPKLLSDRSNGDIRDMFGASASRNNNKEIALFVQGELVEEEVVSDDAMLHEFNAKIDASGLAPRKMKETYGNTAHPSSAASRQLSVSSEHETPSFPVAGKKDKGTPPLLKKSDGPNKEPQLERNSSKPGPPPHDTTERRRSKSSCLPLERVPEHQQMHNIIHHSEVALKDITASLGKLDVMTNVVSWLSEAENAYETFADAVDAAMVEVWSLRIKTLLEKELARLEAIGEEDAVLACVGTLSRLERVEKDVV